MSSREAPIDGLYQQLQRVYVLLDDGDRRALASVGLTPTHYNLLRVLDGLEPGAGRTVTQLAEALLCTRGNATRLVRRLVDAGLVHTGGDSSDQRVVWVYLTEEGRDRLAAARIAMTASLRGRFEFMSAEDVDRMHQLATQLADELIKQRDNER